MPTTHYEAIATDAKIYHRPMEAIMYGVNITLEKDEFRRLKTPVGLALGVYFYLLSIRVGKQPPRDKEIKTIYNIEKCLPPYHDNKTLMLHWAKLGEALLFQSMRILVKKYKCWTEIMASTDMTEILRVSASTLLLRKSDQELVVNLVMYWHMAQHELSGKRVYDVSSGLGYKLQHTEIRGLYTEDVRLPYNNIYIIVPKEVDLKIWNDDSGWHKVVGIYVSNDIDWPNELKTIEGQSYRTMNMNEPKERLIRMLVVGENKKKVFASYHLWTKKNR